MLFPTMLFVCEHQVLEFEVGSFRKPVEGDNEGCFGLVENKVCCCIQRIRCVAVIESHPKVSGWLF